jgi:hypothetical protein
MSVLGLMLTKCARHYTAQWDEEHRARRLADSRGSNAHATVLATILSCTSQSAEAILVGDRCGQFHCTVGRNQMRPLQITLFVMGLLVLTTQTFRHVYVKWVEPTTSVLDQFNDQTEQDIAAAKSLDELVTLYAEVHRKVKEEDLKTKDAKERDYSRTEREPYKSEWKLRQAIETREGHSKKIFELHFFWACGAGSLVVGLLCYRLVNRWLGIAGVIAGFLEMLWWTAPQFRAFGSGVEFDRLLTQKIIFSLISWVLLVGLWLAVDRRQAPMEIQRS